MHNLAWITFYTPMIIKFWECCFYSTMKINTNVVLMCHLRVRRNSEKKKTAEKTTTTTVITILLLLLLCFQRPILWYTNVYSRIATRTLHLIYAILSNRTIEWKFVAHIKCQFYAVHCTCCSQKSVSWFHINLWLTYTQLQKL